MHVVHKWWLFLHAGTSSSGLSRYVAILLRVASIAGSPPKWTCPVTPRITVWRDQPDLRDQALADRLAHQAVPQRGIDDPLDAS
jgi:hypothetical protein